ncbi:MULTISPECIES: condensation domain-containing protein [unclassified Plantibacter]|uniref:condensation domain-containing protein n=1 Tax=unclassified Plantibacter TaxID=2624265 RepID=UPI0039C9B9B9
MHSRHNMRLCVEVPDTGWGRTELVENLRGYLSSHDSFRTRFDLKGSTLMQTVEPALDLHIGHLDVDEDLDLMSFEDLWAVADSEPFEPRDGTLLRLSLGVSASRVRFVALSASHMAMDGASINVLIEDLENLFYRRPVKASGVQPLDWAQWEQGDKGQRTHQMSLAHWRRVLEMSSDEQGGSSRRGARQGTSDSTYIRRGPSGPRNGMRILEAPPRQLFSRPPLYVPGRRTLPHARRCRLPAE